MPEYIERDKIGLTDFEIVICNGDYKEALKMLLEKIESAPAADVRSVVSGEWTLFGRRGIYGVMYECSACHAKYDGRTNFCPNCGADMRQEPT